MQGIENWKSDEIYPSLFVLLKSYFAERFTKSIIANITIPITDRRRHFFEDTLLSLLNRQRAEGPALSAKGSAIANIFGMVVEAEPFKDICVMTVSGRKM